MDAVSGGELEMHVRAHLAILAPTYAREEVKEERAGPRRSSCFTTLSRVARACCREYARARRLVYIFGTLVCESPQSPGTVRTRLRPRLRSRTVHMVAGYITSRFIAREESRDDASLSPFLSLSLSFY